MSEASASDRAMVARRRINCINRVDAWMWVLALLGQQICQSKSHASLFLDHQDMLLCSATRPGGNYPLLAWWVFFPLYVDTAFCKAAVGESEGIGLAK